MACRLYAQPEKKESVAYDWDAGKKLARWYLNYQHPIGILKFIKKNLKYLLIKY